MMRRRVLLVAAGAMAGVVALASLAWACTAIVNSSVTTVSPTTAKPLDKVTASASNVGADRVWMLHFLNFSSWQHAGAASHGCMGDVTRGGTDVIIGGPVTSSGGVIPATTGTIPADAQDSLSAWVCFIEWAPLGGYALSAVTNPADLDITDEIVPL